MDLMEVIKPQLDSMNEMYRVGYKAGIAEGRRQVWLEVKGLLKEVPHASTEAK
jgi:hypothetical protein